MHVTMIIICWVLQHGAITESWRIERDASLKTCLEMNNSMNSGGRAGVITVECKIADFSSL